MLRNISPRAGFPSTLRQSGGILPGLTGGHRLKTGHLWPNPAQHHPRNNKGARPPLLLSIDTVSKLYPGSDRPVFSDLSLDLEPGETLALTGESGSGKSTLLHLAAALDTFDAGEITLDGQPYSTLADRGRAALRRGKVALVFQQFNLIPSMTVAQNLDFHARLGQREDRAWTAHLTAALGLAPFLARFPEQLSGGQQQRVAIGRALALRPALLLADEPTGNLDEATGDAVLDLMLGLTSDSGAALFLVTHSDRIAARLSRRAHLASGRLT